MNLDESNRTIGLPDPSLVLLFGARGAGKSTFARRFFDSSEIVSLEECRRMVGDDGTSAPSSDAMELFQSIVQNRLYAGKLVVVDGDNTNAEVRRSLVTLARRQHLFAIAIALRIDERICIERNATRSDCVVSPYDVKRGCEAVRKMVELYGRDGIRDMHVIDSPEAMDKAVVKRHRLWTDKRDDTGPFDIIGDVHGCADELEVLLDLLGYRISWADDFPHGVRVVPPAGRRVVFLGDLIDRGPRIVDSLRLAMSMVQSGAAICVPGNHEVKLLKKLRGKPVSITHGLAETLAEFERMPASFHDDVACFIDKLVGHYMLDGGRLCVVHAGIKSNMQGRSSSAAREFGLYGDTTGETDEYGLPVRHEWAHEYHGRATIVYGHTPMLTAEWLNNTICIDTGCVFGGALTALRYPEREIVSVPAAKRYFEPKKPLVPRVSQAGSMGEKPPEDGLSLDVLRAGGVIKTRFRYDVAIPEEHHVFAVMEMLSRFGVDPRWLVYMPPVVSPVDASDRPGLLEHPAEAFAYYQRQGVTDVVCQEKRDGLPVVVSVCRDVHAARMAFRTNDGRTGIIHTRTGRPIFAERQVEDAWIERCRLAAENAKIFDSHGPFVTFEARLSRPMERPQLPSNHQAFNAVFDALTRTAARGIDVGEIAERWRRRQDSLSQYNNTLLHRAETSVNPKEISIVPSSVLATDEVSWFARPYQEHEKLLKRLVHADASLFAGAAAIDVRIGDAESERLALCAWNDWTAQGAEGMLVKPVAFQRNSRPGLTLPALACRGAEALRWIHGPEYDVESNLERLRRRSLSALRFRALGQFVLGMEAVERFVGREPLSRIHLCVSAALALECQSSEPRS
jgi:protein phosphatase